MRALIVALSICLSVAAGGQDVSGPRSSPSQAAEGDLQLRINGPIHVGARDTASAVWVINHDATVDGVVRSGLGVVNGSATINGRVEGGVVVVNGRLALGPDARIERDVMLYRSTITRAPGAIVNGAVHSQSGFSLGAGAAWLVWLSFSVVVVLAGLLFAELAPRTLTESAQYLAGHAGRSALMALVIAFAVPGIAIMSFATVIGIPLGLTLILVVIPALTFLGYLVAGEVLGAVLLSRLSDAGRWSARYRTVFVGLVTLQFVSALPGLGGLMALCASLLGVGALVGRSWAQRERGVRIGAPAPVTP